jgi:hypothetical protein
MRKLPVLKSPEKGANSQKRIYREISATCKSEKAEIPEDSSIFLPICLTQCGQKVKTNLTARQPPLTVRLP